MSGYYSSGLENTNSMDFMQNCFGGPALTEGDLTDEYIVNMMDEISVTNSEYEPTKFYDQMRDVVNFSSSPRDVSYTHEVPRQDTLFPATPEQVLLSPDSSSYLTTPSPYMAPSPAMSSASSLVYEQALYSPQSSSDTLTFAESPVRVLEDQQVPQKKKRGRKPKSVSGKAESPSGLQTKSRRPKVYEIDQPFNDKEKERRRINAVNAKRHRDLQKEEKKVLERQLADVEIEREILKTKNKEMEEKLALLSQQLEAFQNYFGVKTIPVMTLYPEEHLQF